MQRGALAAAFLAAVPGSGPSDEAALEGALRERVDAGRAAWPDLALDDESFVRHLAAASEGAGLPSLEHAGDLWLACACGSEVPGAAAAFERAHRETIERAVRKIDRNAVDEATQGVMVSLLVREPDAPPRIVTYGGRASLRTWLTTVATRAALKLHRRKSDAPHASLTGLADAVAGAEPELAFAKTRHGPELAAALRAALGTLDARQLVLLRLHHAEGWSVDRLGALYSVGRSTAARWVAAARDALLGETKRILTEKLGLTPSELESLVVILQSNLDVSLVRLLEAEKK